MTSDLDPKPPRGEVRAARHPLATAVVVLLILVLVDAGGVASSVGLIRSGLNTRALAQPVAGWVRTTGTITGSKRVFDGKSYVYAPVVAFTAAGQRVVFAASTSSDQPAIGDVVPVSYDPHYPGSAHDLADGAWRITFDTGLAILAIVVLVVSLEIWAVVHIIRRKLGNANRGN